MQKVIPKKLKSKVEKKEAARIKSLQKARSNYPNVFDRIIVISEK